MTTNRNRRNARNARHADAWGRAPLVTMLAIVDVLCIGFAVARIFA